MIFAARCYASAALAVTGCPSVRLSRSYILTKRIFPSSGSYTILVFPYQTAWQYSDGNPPNGGVECSNAEISISGFTACCEQWRRQGGGGSRGMCPACKTLCPGCAPAVELRWRWPFKRISWLRATDYFEDVNYDVINITLNSFFREHGRYTIDVLYKKFSCRGEAARCLMSLNISLSHSRSLKMAPSIDRIRAPIRLSL